MTLFYVFRNKSKRGHDVHAAKEYMRLFVALFVALWRCIVACCLLRCGRWCHPLPLPPRGGCRPVVVVPIACRCLFAACLLLVCLRVRACGVVRGAAYDVG